MSGLEVVDLRAARGEFRLGPVGFEVEERSATTVLGPSGAGKTTLLRAIAGFLPLRAGAIRLEGRAITDLPPEERRLGFVPPDLGLFAHRRVRRNVSYPLELRGDLDAMARANEWMERFDLVRLADRYPRELSSGERQRVAMARALAAEPRLLLWDEPLAAVDVESRDSLLRLLRRLLDEQGIPLVLVTHDPATALALAARWVVLDLGRIRFDGPPRDLAAGPLDRFTARFLGHENLFDRAELVRVEPGPLRSVLIDAAGPEGVAVPGTAVRLGPAGGPSPGRVESVRWTPAGWTVTARAGSLSLRTAPLRDPPTVRVGDAVDLSLDVPQLKPLGDVGGWARP